MDCDNQDTSRDVNVKQEMAMFKTGGSIYGKVPKAFILISICNDSTPNE